MLVLDLQYTPEKYEARPAFGLYKEKREHRPEQANSQTQLKTEKVDNEHLRALCKCSGDDLPYKEQDEPTAQIERQAEKK
jgi:hypothetical protein